MAGDGAGAWDATTGPRLTLCGLDRLMPLHVWVGPTGHVQRVGPTLAKLRPGEGLAGRRLLEVFELRRPRGVHRFADLLGRDGAKLQLSFRAAPRTSLKGAFVRLADGQGALLDLSPGLSVTDTVARFGLTGSDFPPSDPTVEMLYLIEAQSAILAESRKLNHRLDEARLAAEREALTDTLTGLRNRRALEHLLERLTDAHLAEPFGLMHLDLDYFKQVNDSLGHAAGDHVLCHVAKVLGEETRRDDMVARIGGDEFVVICRRCDDPATLDRIARRIIARLEVPIPYAGHVCRVSASIGTAISSAYARPTSARMLRDADRALYASKDGGRARHTLFAVAKPGVAGRKTS